ncbi:hypothetical protein EVAR_65056_1 [Eumeta japonica]|uniref:Uncharacterized protein n=1 Tax=Eumeta variegata TaxID=151549 RepID=A0A4C1ZZE0_EUMVA|nr:hypothetical protein EVAR_65056_1 [Eumeta japonica]
MLDDGWRQQAAALNDVSDLKPGADNYLRKTDLTHCIHLGRRKSTRFVPRDRIEWSASEYVISTRKYQDSGKTYLPSLCSPSARYKAVCKPSLYLISYFLEPRGATLSRRAPSYEVMAR